MGFERLGLIHIYTGEGKSIENTRNEQVRVIQARMIRGTGDNPAREEIIVAANDGAEAKIIAMINERPPEYGDVNAYSEGKPLPKYYAHKLYNRIKLGDNLLEESEKNMEAGERAWLERAKQKLNL